MILGQQLIRFYEEYSSLDVTFTKDVVKAIGLVPKQVYLKCIGYQWPCIIYSSSMVSAKVIVNAKLGIQTIAQKANNMVSLRFSLLSDKPDPVSFFVSAKIAGALPYGTANPGLNILVLTFTQRPADDLISALGELLEANVNSKKRKEERIVLTPEVMEKMGFKAKETTLFVEKVPRKGIIRDISFSGAKVIIAGVAKFMVQKNVVIHLENEHSPEPLIIEGTILRFEPVEGRKDISAFAIQFKEEGVPLRYKIMVNDYLRQKKHKPAAAAQQKPVVENPLPPPPPDASPEAPPPPAEKKD
ncbi:MAG: PilZ domain-containing protein [Spirochaetia bacterium]|jgi:hypothetical protein|nr:PilZ domain-containing protein [Spirochaetia bacterium]